MTQAATIRTPREGRRLGVVGDVYRFLVTGEETDGKYATFEAFVPPGGGPPPHLHRREAESFLVLEGVMTFQHGDERIVASEGTFLHMPVGSVHCFKNESNEVARLLISVVPAGLEQMFFEVGLPLGENDQSAPPPTAADIEKLIEASSRYGIEIQNGND